MNFIEHVLEPKRLLLVWQGPEGSSRRMRYAVAELARQGDGQVRFEYLVNTDDFKNACAEGFINFPAFRKVDQSYELGVVDTFIRRLPPPSRGDYAQYLEQFRLRPDTKISDFALLAYTGAKLPSDGFSIINPLAQVDSEGEVLLEVAGFRHVSRIPLASLHPGIPVQFAPEPDNAFDPGAVAILVRDEKIGYVPRQQARGIREQLANGSLSAQIERLNGSPERPLVFLFVALRPKAAARTMAM